MEFSDAQKIEPLARAVDYLLSNKGQAGAPTQRAIDETVQCLCIVIKGLTTEQVTIGTVSSKEILDELLTQPQKFGHDPYSGRDPAHVGKQYDAKTDTYR